MNTDAQTVAEYWGNDYRLWSTIWLIFAIVMTLTGLIFARDAKELSKNIIGSAQKRLWNDGPVAVSAKPDVRHQYWAQTM